MTAFRIALLQPLVGLLLLVCGGALAAGPDRARQIASGRCFLCHGPVGESSSELFPRLATQNASYLVKQLRDFQSGRRRGTAMNEMAKNLTEPEMEALGAFYAAQKADPHPPADPALAAVGRDLYAKGNPPAGVASCASCHGASAHGSESLPRLAGQQALYLEAQLRQFNRRERTNDNAVMHAIASKLTELEIRAVAEYLASVP